MSSAKQKQRVLILCTGNSCRSQLAEALWRHEAGDRWDVFSAGTEPKGIHPMTGRRPYAAFVNSTGDRQMREYTKAGDGMRLVMLVLHDDASREYAYGPAQHLPSTKVGAFTQALYDEAMKDGWTVISMKRDWKRIFAFDPQ